jgi:signal peptidase II
VEPNQANANQEKLVVESGTTLRKRHLAAVFVAFACFALDIAAKYLARLYLPQNVSLPFLPSFLRLTLVTNTGAAFSLGQGNAQAVAIISTGVFLLLLVWSIRRYQSGNYPFLEEIGMAMVLGSALGNLVDRYAYGRVTDFLEFELIQFPVFNVADVLIDVGIGLVLLAMYKRGRD